MSEGERVTLALGGEWRSTGGLAPCPICQPDGRKDQRALSVGYRAKKLLVFCHKSGCDVLPELQARGIAGGRCISTGTADQADEKKYQQSEDRRREENRLRNAHELFASAVSCEGTLAQSYLEARGIIGARLDKTRNTLRFHPDVLHSPSGLRLPAMVAQIRGSKGEPLGIHRTFLHSDGTRKAEVTPAKMMLGPSSGGAVRFGPDGRIIALAEGIETALSISRASRMTVWAPLSTSGLKGLILPPAPIAEVVIIAAGHDDAGLEAAAVTAARLEAAGRAVSIIHPVAFGADFNDVLRGA